MWTDPNRTRVLGFGPVVIVAAAPVAKGPVTVGARRCFSPVMFCLCQGLHQQRLQFVPIQKAELFAQKLLRGVRGKPFGQNHLAATPVAMLFAICRLMHWYQVKKSKAKSPPPKRSCSSRKFQVDFFRLWQQPGQKPPRQPDQVDFPRLWHCSAGTRKRN